MKSRKNLLLCALAFLLLLTACPGPESTVPKGKVTVSLSDETIKYFSDTDSVSVELRNTEIVNNQTEGIFALTKSKPYATYTVVPGRYVIILTNDNKLPVYLSENSVEVKEDSDLKVTINLSDSGTVSIQADTELMDDSDKLFLSFSGEFGFSYTIPKSELDKSITLPVGTYSVTLNTSSPWIEAASPSSEVIVEHGKDTQFPVVFSVFGELSVNCAVKPEIPITLNVLKGEEVYKTLTVDSTSIYEKLPIGDYSLSLSTGDKNVDIALNKSEVTITKGEYSNVGISYKENGAVQFNLSNNLQSILSNSEDSFTIKITSAKNEVKSIVFSKDTMKDITQVLPVGQYRITVEGSLGSTRITTLTNDFSLTKGETEVIKLDVEEIGYVSFSFNEVLKEFGDDEYLTVYFFNGEDIIKEVDITKDFDSSDRIEIPTGTYSISIVPSDSSKYIVTADTSSITVQDSEVNVNVIITKSGVCEINISNAAGIKNGIPIEIRFTDGNGVVFPKLINGGSATEIVILPVGAYTVSVNPDPKLYIVKVDNQSITISNETKATIKMSVETDGSVDISLNVGFTPTFKFKIIRYYDYERKETYLKVLNSNDTDIDESKYIVIWYDPDPLNPLKQNVGAEKALTMVKDRLSRIEIRIIYRKETDNKTTYEVIAVRKIDPSKIEEIKEET